MGCKLKIEGEREKTHDKSNDASNSFFLSLIFKAYTTKVCVTLSLKLQTATGDMKTMNRTERTINAIHSVTE